MAIEIQLNLAGSSRAEFNGNSNKSIVVGGIAYGLTSDDTATQSNAFFAILAALQAQHGIKLLPTGSPHPDDPSIVATQLVIDATGGDSATFSILYSTPGGFVPTALLLDVDASLRSVTRDKYPGSQKPIWVGWKGRATESSTGAKDVGLSIPVDAAPFTYPQSIVRVSAYLVRAGRLDESTSATNAGVIGATNNAQWLGRPPGSWLMSNYKSSSSRYGGFYSVRAEAIAKGGAFDAQEDWRVLEVLRDRTTGRLALPDRNLVNAALSAPYKFGKIGTGYNEEVDGFIVHGPHVPVSFSYLWSVLIQ